MSSDREARAGYVEDGQNLVTLAMNGWGAAEPAWWLNLQDHPEAIAETRAVVVLEPHDTAGACRDDR